MAQQWYTVPAWFGGEGFPWHRRLYLEWLWRRHGEDGLHRYLQRLFDRMARELVTMNSVAQDAATQIDDATFAMYQLTRTMRND